LFHTFKWSIFAKESYNLSSLTFLRMVPGENVKTLQRQTTVKRLENITMLLKKQAV